MKMFTVDDHCKKCELCVELCPTNIIAFDEKTGPFVPEKKEKKCLRCGQCVSFCPKSACYLSFQPGEDRRAVGPSLMPAPDVGETFLRSRRSIRFYQDKPVEEQMIRRLLETARYAPSASNNQPVRWVVTRDRKKTIELGALVIDSFKHAALSKPDDPSSAKLKKLVEIWDKGQDIIFRGAPQVAIALVDKSYNFLEDAAIALTYLELAAHAHGLGCCWAGFFKKGAQNSPAIHEFIGAASHEMVAGGQMMGFPDKRLGLSRILPPRKKVSLTWL